MVFVIICESFPQLKTFVVAQETSDIPVNALEALDIQTVQEPSDIYVTAGTNR